MKFVFLTVFVLLIASCKLDQGKIEVTFKNQTKKSLRVEVANIKVLSNQVIIEGADLSIVTEAKVVTPSDSLVHSFSIDSKTSSKLILNATSPLTFLTKNIFKLVLSNASASQSFTIDFSLCEAKIGNKLIDCNVTPQDGYVLSYDTATDKWKPKSLNGITYLGTFDASSGSAPSLQPAGSYYVISVAGTISAINFDVGDWIISNGTNYQKIDNSTSVSSVFGRLGAVTAQEGDYNLDKMSDVDLSTPATNGKVLKYNGATNKWEASDDLSSGGAGSVTSGEIQDGTIVGSDIANNTITLDKLNGTSDATKYLRGDKSWANFRPDVLATPLNGLSSGTGAITATDTVLQAFGKLLSLPDDYVSKTATSQSISGSWSFTNPTSFLYTQTPTGVTPTEVTNVQYVQNYVDAAVAVMGGFAPSTLTTATAASSSDTTLTVASTTGYPNSGTLLIGSEAIIYTGKTGTTFTGLTRGAFGTTAATITGGTTVNNYILLSRSTTNVTPKMVVTGAGNVGIGKINPTTALDVNGEVRIGNTSSSCTANNSGSIRYNSSTSVLEFCNGTSWNLVQAAACTDATPNVVSFGDEANATLSTLVVSSIIQVTGINCAVPITISGTGSPQYRICDDGSCSTIAQDWTNTPSSISNNQYIQTRLTSDNVGGSQFQATIIVGSGASVWSVTTAGGDCTASPTPGTVCADGTVYAGLSPDGNAKMFTTRCDAGQTWNGVSCTGSRSNLSWNNGSSNWTVTGITGNTTGKSNSAALNAVVDAGSPNIAAQYCESLNDNGHSDWYLPAIAELNVLYSNKSIIKNFSSTLYWSSTETNDRGSVSEQFSDGWQPTNYYKATGYYVRCVRR